MSPPSDPSRARARLSTLFASGIGLRLLMAALFGAVAFFAVWQVERTAQHHRAAESSSP